MIAYQVGIVLCRVAAVVLIIQTIRSLGFMIPSAFFDNNGFMAEFLGFALLSVAPGFAAIGLWLFADRICRLPPVARASPAEQPLSELDIVRAGMALVGIYLFIDGLLRAVETETANLALQNIQLETDRLRRMFDEQSARLLGVRASYIAELMIAVLLILGKEKLSALALRARYAGATKT